MLLETKKLFNIRNYSPEVTDIERREAELTHEKINRIWISLTRNWQLNRDWGEIKQENMITFITLQ